MLDGLRRDDLFTVVLEHFQTDTADYADYVLPATTQLEHWDIIKPYGHLHLALNRPAIAPVGQSLPNSEIFSRLAAAMGYAEPCFAQSDEEILRQLVESQTHPTFDGITWDALLDKGFMRLNLPQPYLPFAQGDFHAEVASANLQRAHGPGRHDPRRPTPRPPGSRSAPSSE